LSRLQERLYGQRDAGFFGYSHFTGGFPGGQAEYVRVPKGSVNLLPIPNSVPDEKALFLSDIIPTSYHCVVDTGVTEGDIVAIWVGQLRCICFFTDIPSYQGLGPIGMCAAQWAKLKGASRIIGIDKVPERLALARIKLGVETLDFTEHKDVPKRLLELAPGGVDVALDCGEPVTGFGRTVCISRFTYELRNISRAQVVVA